MPDERDTFAVMLSQLQMTIGWQYRASGFVESGAVFFAPVVERKTEGEAENLPDLVIVPEWGFFPKWTRRP